MIGPVPARVDGTVKAELLAIIDDAVAGGWAAAKACSVLGLDRQRAWRWHCRREGGVALEDLASGGNPIHGLLRGSGVGVTLGALCRSGGAEPCAKP